ncbi:hypothetical protein POM88_023842 [Heracleum sosnowskyi]|uniref:Cytochrome P450 n=1 Tax=Heracleum sosnowskyi TaxID=360622 RepID=A0AAD8IHS8_9APIA|nr:hypothetical protein POM88_023842 [Heracleum sosnowskyi]
METWFIIVVSFSISILLKFLLSVVSTNKRLLPPGPTTVSLLVNYFLWFRDSISDLETYLQQLMLKYGPIITLNIGSRAAVFIGSHELAHISLVENGSIFSDRPKTLPASKIVNSDQHIISAAKYGPTWRLLRRNLSSEILHPAQVKLYSQARERVMSVLVRRLFATDNNVVRVVDHFQDTMSCLLVRMCFGDKLEENEVKKIEGVQRELLLNLGRFHVLNFWPIFGKILFYKRWRQLYQLRRNQEDVLIPLIEARVEKSKEIKVDREDFVTAYVDTLMKLKLPEEGNRKLSYEEIVSLCLEFLNAGTDTITSALQWIMANLVKHPEIQARLYDEIVSVSGNSPSLLGEQVGKLVVVKEADLQQMSYLKAVVLESLRLHPPGHFLLPHSVTEEIELNGYVIPKDVRINFMVAQMGRDPKVWDDPMEFKPERFLNENGDAFDITGSREIKMMPFGAGRRICPGLNLALLHLEYFVANLVWYFEWNAPADILVDLSEKLEVTAVMKNPLLAQISPRA